MQDADESTLATQAAVRALARIVVGDSDAESVLQRVCDAAKAVITDAQDASVTLLEPAGPRTAKATGDLALGGDRLQYAAGEGPCLDAARNGATVVVQDLGQETRWPGYATAALDLGIRASLSVPLEVDSAVVGALNIYAGRPQVFDQDRMDVAADVARVAGVVATAVAQRDRASTLAGQMQRALDSRAVIEQAKGILMAQRRCSAEEAFQVLVRLSQESNRKLRDLARILVEQTASR